jgi:hypothetical protein
MRKKLRLHGMAKKAFFMSFLCFNLCNGLGFVLKYDAKNIGSGLMTFGLRLLALYAQSFSTFDVHLEQLSTFNCF